MTKRLKEDYSSVLMSENDDVLDAIAELILAFEEAVAGFSPEEISETKQELFDLVSEQLDGQLAGWEDADDDDGAVIANNEALEAEQEDLDDGAVIANNEAIEASFENDQPDEDEFL